jgi:hypothetical protein
MILINVSIVSHLSTFDDLRFIYLSEPYHFDHISQIRGVFLEHEQLFNQLKKYVKIIDDSDTHLKISPIGESTRNETAIKNLQSNNQSFMKRENLRKK